MCFIVYIACVFCVLYAVYEYYMCVCLVYELYVLYVLCMCCVSTHMWMNVMHLIFNSWYLSLKSLETSAVVRLPILIGG